MEEGGARGADIRVPPPLLYLLPLAAGLLVQRFVPVQLVRGAGAERIIALAGAAEIFVGVALAAWAFITLRRLGTPILPGPPTRALAQRGPYALTRNPIYLSMAIVYVGITLVTNALWPLLFFPEALVFTYLLVIKAEETYLAREFGDEYAAYRARVRRWV